MKNIENDIFNFIYNGINFSFYLPNKEEYIAKKIINTKSFYEIDLLEELGRFPLKKGIICDVGANIGNHSIYFASILNKKVYSFEPLNICNEILNKNIILNNLENKIISFPIALGSKKSKGNMNVNENNLGASRIENNLNGEIEISILDNCIEKNINVSVIKIDVEGFEKEVLKGAVDTIKRCKPLIIVETQTYNDFLQINNKLNSFEYIPIGIKGFTNTLFYIHKNEYELNKLLILNTFLIRQDLVNTRKRIQGQSDNISKKLDLLIENVDDNKSIDSIKESIENSSDSIIKSINNNLKEIESQRILDDNKSIDSIKESIENSSNFVTEKLIEEISKNNKFYLIKEKVNKIETILKYAQNDNIKEEISKNIEYFQKYLNMLIEINSKQELKIKTMFKHKYRLFLNFILKIFNVEPHTFEKYNEKLQKSYNLKTENKEDVVFRLKDLQNKINQVFEVSNELNNEFKKVNLDEIETTKMIENVNKNTNNLFTNTSEIRFENNNKNFNSSKTFIGIAAIPSRENALKKTIESLINQVDEIGVYLNGWDKIPTYLNNNKIVIIKSQDKGDIGDAGKFYWVDNHEGFYFTCDDDIVYPENYISGIINKIKEYKYKSVIGWHGSLIIEPFSEYYSTKSRRVFAFGSNRPEDTFVHILGTGTIGFHTSTINVKLKDFKKPNMADVFFAELGQQQKIPFIVMKHEAKKMISIEEVQEDSINKHGINNIDSKKNTKEYQNELVKFINWKLNNSNKLKILLIGRFENFTKGGIYKSNHLIKRILLELGHEVINCDSQVKEFKIENDIDVALIYPGDMLRPDFQGAEEKMNILRKKNIPVCINLSYNTNLKRNKEIVDKIKFYNNQKGLSKVFLMTFTNSTLTEENLKEIKEFIIPMPKTIVGEEILNEQKNEYKDREGIVLGDATKLMNLDITEEDIKPWVSAVKKLLPHVKLYVFKQYSGKFDLPGVEVVPYMENNFLDWVAKRKLFVCLNKITTFEMTPTEAQTVGTPIIYRPMQQSLSEYISHSGISVTNPEEFAEMCAWLYNDEYAWNSYSKLSYKNSEKNKIENLSIGLEASIRKIIFKSSI